MSVKQVVSIMSLSGLKKKNKFHPFHKQCTNIKLVNKTPLPYTSEAALCNLSFFEWEAKAWQNRFVPRSGRLFVVTA